MRSLPLIGLGIGFVILGLGLFLVTLITSKPPAGTLNKSEQRELKGQAVIMVLFPLGGICSMAERKVSAWIQGRPGPNRAIVPWVAWIPFFGTFLQRLGLFHVMADGGKMLFKEDALPGHVNKFYFVLAPIVAMIPALTTVTAVPFGAYLDEA